MSGFPILIFPILVCVALMTLAERKILSLIGFRQGPNKVSLQGIMQPLSDAMKLANKSCNIISNFSHYIYYFSVLMMLFCSMAMWSTISFTENWISWKMSILILMLVLGVSSMKAIMAGWSTYGKYPLVGSMRTVSQMISYESVLYLCLLSIIWMIKSFGVSEWGNQEMNMIWILIPLIFMFWIPSVLAELNRTPYDFSEGESELVSGFNTEFGASSFTMIFLSEYSSIIFFMLLSSMIFMGKMDILMLALTFTYLNYWMIWIRSSLPRMRFDKFMNMAWKFYIPSMTVILLVLLSKI